MAYIDVKITDLTQVSSFEDKDLFLVSHPLYDSDGALQETPYTSDAISGGALKETFANSELSVKNRWHFVGGKENIPTQKTKLNTDGLISALQDASKLSSMLHDEEAGWYKDDLSSSVMQQEGFAADTTDALSVTNDSIPNIDYVDRAIAGAYNSVLRHMQNLIQGNFIPSHVGEIIHSTVLSSEALVKAKYGNGNEINGIRYPNTTWIQHSGYFLRGSNSDVLSGVASSQGGADTVVLNANQIPSHAHGITSSTAKITATLSNPTVKVPGGKFGGPRTGGSEEHGSGGGETATYNATVNSSVGCSVSGGSVTINYAADSKTNPSGGGQGHENRPAFKNVYIWERTA